MHSAIAIELPSTPHRAYRYMGLGHPNLNYFFCEVRMPLTRYTTVKSRPDVISGILNCVCPECGGRMGGRGMEFRCRGECLTDWRQVWELAAAESGMRSG